jgi:glycosyltransferase involved in cell wall biosynthesis
MPGRTSRRLRIALVGTRGVPARYGGFETAVEEVGRRLVEAGHDVVVYCRTTTGGPQPSTHLGMRLVHLPALRRRSLETLSHTGLSVAHLVTHRVDAAIVFNAANAPWLPLLRAARIPVATHVDGLEWKRAKWGGIGKRYYRIVEALSVRWSDALIADAQGIADYYSDEFAAPTELLAYGAPKTDGTGSDRLASVDLTSRGYHLVVARFEPENHVDVIVDGYRRSEAELPLVVVGSAPYADDYTRRVHRLADDRVRFLGGVWDQDLLDQLYAHCHTYLHGHSVGGTNPSLLRAIGAGAATIAYDVSFNREVLETSGQYFRTPDDVAQALTESEARPDRIRRLGKRARLLSARYDWDHVAAGYEDLCRRLSRHEFPRSRPSGRRLRLGPAATTTGWADDRGPTASARDTGFRPGNRTARPHDVTAGSPDIPEAPNARSAQS